ncbi:Phosphatidylserine/phosphatidylglycerophosphate/cardiolipin synthase [Lobosporangium transversale]|uniref:Mitochondrial cardiolipin hydrolase n=1 Tax=Lobosporangium transversale TaxID=64571 RepID=A0A1Y2GJT1_9FUNG|nr:Phosphatidylserine/phosphatidylglycerophosphate/cardiolipin synthase [Lobosporangium transversale]ORZ13000.1 Phosphatidylserine/phosphatidylglycerophosphate/cardiolipin synthase [Lobosporangium transversale]|eukprot:XP_021880349.1 Phosphatidylserine/phosphatidylglycerophosphate/cardiolipin synthase [Lobosporangium transversale]
MLVKTLDDAKKSLDICVFTITDDQLAKAIIRAHERGVKVRIIADNDKAEDLGSDVHRLTDEHNIPSRLDNSPSHMHHKFAVIDDALVINGSYNWTKGARFDNRENLTLTNSPKAVQGFKAEFERLWSEFA